VGVFRKKPVEIEAVQFDGCEYVDNVAEPMFDGCFDGLPEWLTGARAKAESEPGAVFVDLAEAKPGEDPDDSHVHGALLTIVTLEGAIHASPGDYIIRGVAGELYPCKPDIFAQTYEPVFIGRTTLGAGVPATAKEI
jgi:hypothetical protein